MSLLERIPGVNRIPAVKRAVQKRVDEAAAHAAEIERSVSARKWATNVTAALRFAADDRIRFRESVHREGTITIATIDDKPFFSVRSARTPGNRERVQLDVTLPADYPHIRPPSDEPASPTVIHCDEVRPYGYLPYEQFGFKVGGNNAETIRAMDEAPIAHVSDSLYDVLRRLYLGAPEIMERARAERGDPVLAKAFQSANPPQK